MRRVHTTAWTASSAAVQQTSCLTVITNCVEMPTRHRLHYSCLYLLLWCPRSSCVKSCQIKTACVVIQQSCLGCCITVCQIRQHLGQATCRVQHAHQSTPLQRTRLVMQLGLSREATLQSLYIPRSLRLELTSSSCLYTPNHCCCQSCVQARGQCQFHVQASGVEQCVSASVVNGCSTILTMTYLKRLPARARCVWSKSVLAGQTCSERLGRGGK